MSELKVMEYVNSIIAIINQFYTALVGQGALQRAVIILRLKYVSRTGCFITLLFNDYGYMRLYPFAA